MATESTTWQPDWAVPPGEILLETIQDRGLSQSELARRMGRPTKTINEIVNGKAALTPDTAIQLELTLGISASFWNNAEGLYRAHLARVRAEEQLESNASWADAFPLTDLVRHKLIVRGSTKGQTVANLLSYFGVGSAEAWESQWRAPAAAFRASPAFQSAPQAVAAWLRWGELLAARVQTQPFDYQGLREAMSEVRGLTRQADFMATVERVKEMLARVGVVLLLTPEFTGTRLSGAARWMTPDRAVIQLTMRYKTTDQFWFSLFHEAGHLLDGNRADHVDLDDSADSTDSSEQFADKYARDALIPPDDYEVLLATADFGEQAVRTFAKQQGIAPAIVVGRLQRDEMLPKSHLSQLKKSITWAK
jgi:addiction module HigA family antidote